MRFRRRSKAESAHIYDALPRHFSRLVERVDACHVSSLSHAELIHQREIDQLTHRCRCISCIVLFALQLDPLDTDVLLAQLELNLDGRDTVRG